MPLPLDYVKYYDLERYLFEDVHEHFQNDHFIGAFDFFSIVVWKANRAKSWIAQRLRKHASSDARNDIDAIVRRLTASLYDEKDTHGRLQLLLNTWGFRLPTASAILTVLWPEEFTVYDVRVCDELKRHYGDQLRSFHDLADLPNFDDIWQGYCEYRKAVDGAAPNGLSLRDKDRYLWARSAARQLEENITTGLVPTRRKKPVRPTADNPNAPRAAADLGR